MVHSHTDVAVCPHCNHNERDSWEIELGSGHEQDGVTTCNSCGEDYFLSRHTEVTYSSRPIAARKGEGE